MKLLFTIRVLSVISATSLGLGVAGCAKDPAKEAPAAKVEEPKVEPVKAQEPQPAAIEPAAAVTAAVPAPSAVSAAAAAPAAPGLTMPGLALTGAISAVGSKVSGSHSIDFNQWRGGAELVDGKAEGGKLAFEIQVAALQCDTGNRNPYTEKLEGHLKSKDFFEVETFPTATFVSSAIKSGADPAVAGSTHTITGDLTLRGKTKQVTFAATVSIVDKVLSAKSEFSINRKDFGIEYPGKADDLIRDGVVLKIDVKAALP